MLRQPSQPMRRPESSQLTNQRPGKMSGAGRVEAWWHVLPVCPGHHSSVVLVVTSESESS